MTIQYRTIRSSSTLTEAQLNALGEEDLRLVEVIADDIGYVYVFEE